MILVNVASCNSYNSDLSKVQWVPTYLDIAHEGNVRTIILTYDSYDGVAADCSEKPEDWEVTAKINDSNKIAEIQASLQAAKPDTEEFERWWKDHPDWKANYYKYGGGEGECGSDYYTEKMLFIDDVNNGFILSFDADSMSKKVRFCGGSSKKLYEVIRDQNSWNIIFQEDEIGLKDIGISDINWFPTFEDFKCKGTEDIKMLIFLEDDANKPENCTELGRITDPQKIKEFMGALGENVKEPGWEGKIVKMAIINKKNQGMIRKMAWDYANKRVLSFQQYSEKAFKILEELKIIKNKKGP